MTNLTTRDDAEGGGSRFVQPLREFLAAEAAGGLVLLLATVVVLIWANSPWQASYTTLWNTELVVEVGSHSLALTLREFVNEGLLSLFFLIVGLEIKREFVHGELRNPRQAALPIIGAFGGMAVPALIFVLFNFSTSEVRGWGIPMATDIAIVVGLMTLLGSRVAPSLKLFLLTLAIVDDIGAIVALALFYSGGLKLTPLLVAGALALSVFVLRIFRVRWNPVYVSIGLALWLAVHDAGIHATIAGVFMGLMAPAHPFRRHVRAEDLADVSTTERARETALLARYSASQVEWLEHILHPWTSFLIIPLFALANAGVQLDASSLEGAVNSRVAWGVVIGLVVGKPLGIFGFAWLATRLRVATVPAGASWSGLLGVAIFGGIGFTVSLFIASLAFTDATSFDNAKLGVLCGSLLSGVLGMLIFLRKSTSRANSELQGMNA